MIDYLSISTISVLPHLFAEQLTRATAFVVVSNDNQKYFVTNYHVAAGRHPETDQPLRTDRMTPDRLLFVVYFGETDKSHCWRPYVLPTERNGQPTWYLHPEYGRRFDVVAIPIPQDDAHAIPSIPVGPWPNVAVHPGSDVVILGYPEGLSGAGAFPIWKSGGIASEPDLMIQDADFGSAHDYFWIDSNTRSGMSGAPVFARRFGTYLNERGGTAMTNSTVDRLLGVYAGRELNAKDVTLGRVWRLRGLAKLLEHADNRLRSGDQISLPWRLGHYAEQTMATIENFTLAPTGTPDVGSSKEVIADVINVILTNDHRFGLGIERVRQAAQVAAACAEAKEKQTPIGISQQSAALLLEALQQPMGWFMPPPWRAIIADLDRLIAELKRVVANT